MAAETNRSPMGNRGAGYLTTVLSAVTCVRTVWDEWRTSRAAMLGSDLVTLKIAADLLPWFVHEEDKKFCTEPWQQSTSPLNPWARPRFAQANLAR